MVTSKHTSKKFVPLLHFVMKIWLPFTQKLMTKHDWMANRSRVHPQQERACKMLFYFNLLSLFQHYVNNTIAIDLVVLSLSLQAFSLTLNPPPLKEDRVVCFCQVLRSPKTMGPLCLFLAQLESPWWAKGCAPRWLLP